MPPFTPPTRPLSEMRVALVTTGGVHLPEQARFDIDDPLGDSSYREIPSDTPVSGLTWTHFYHAPDRGKDLEEILPVGTLLRIAAEGLVGSVNDRHFSFMGAIHDAGVLIDETAPEVAGKLLSDGVDGVLLTPSCPLCHRSVGLIAGEIERSGIPTVTVSIQDGTDAPRVARVPFPYNSPMGEAGDTDLHRTVALSALRLLEGLEVPGETRLELP